MQQQAKHAAIAAHSHKTDTPNWGICTPYLYHYVERGLISKDPDVCQDSRGDGCGNERIQRGWGGMGGTRSCGKRYCQTVVMGELTFLRHQFTVYLLSRWGFYGVFL